ncbi:MULTISPECIES: hydrolase [Clostridium]|uniref:Aminopeptidase YsdC n=4 Tax=Clostridium TaxID=1485 RepID=D8GK91_CLOLD|nr:MULTISPECIES: hydrolase [Clostridium]ADK13209.1 predicted hydrolase [Clostridium ljungdahlii DSM 13528]AGY76433.1 M42 family peptidase [Clostridium autoethanogenum DSM 10061]ALU36597.1 Cellulase [Clostridium autoethanogenum DSM 10061]OAA83126.1 putative aminopeptidase YsdC [Clostridium ljungdahlii DSM 13528]OAA84558.1 putative aminopeptidase YsdC [Clostridium coskatii]
MDKLLIKLINSFGVSGKEDEVREVIKERLNEINQDMYEDDIGNVIVKLGSGETKIMLCTHMDSVGFIVNHIDDDGMIRVDNIGNFKKEDISHSFIRFDNGTLGKIYTSHEGEFVDIGVNEREDALKKVNEGDMASLVGPYLSVGDNNVISPLLHNKVGCYILLKLIEYVKVENAELDFVFASQGEIGGIGARIAANNINPDYCIIVGTENATNAEERKNNINIDEGPVIKIMDSSLIMHKDIKEMLENCAKRSEINLQYSISTGKSEGELVHKERIGIRTGEIAVPCRYKYSTSEMVSINDIEDTIKLLKQLENFKEII